MTPGLAIDPLVSQRWTAVAHGARMSQRVLQGIGDPGRKSRFADLNDLYPFEKASDWHRAYLGAALEHLALWADIVAPLRFHPDHVVHHTFRPAYTLARAALEAASQAVWMTGGDTARECIRRHLSLIRWDFAEHRKSILTPEGKAQVAERDDALLRRVEAEFAEAELRPPTHHAVLRAAAPIAGMAADELEWMWRAASGSAHGRVWPSLSLQHVVPLEEYEPGHYRTLRIPDAAGMTAVLEAADRMTLHGVLRHADYSGADIPRLMEESRIWLASVVPFRADADPDAVARLRRPGNGPRRPDPSGPRGGE